MPESLFVYGTLQDPKVQKEVFGRSTDGQPDILEGYKKSQVEIQGVTYPILMPSEEDEIEGLVIKVTPDELGKIDEYETETYRRTEVTLKSGRQAWVYEKNEG